jgi:hypothetical protein
MYDASNKHRLLRNGMNVDIERSPASRMTQELLRHFDIRANSPSVLETPPCENGLFA